ncbi:hypothetical protein GCM10007857_64250 [Bradyrhizobium iriomotense]|uniref:Uncharacterized protein n=1 Tax=Bradyrhizobium iriomotense TaxID=441950 RepID=A0ABQ6B7A9_9BRAD|nr:hypothetical protein GCM10007857_64250 [Bradyrhizobium iriomotense]
MDLTNEIHFNPVLFYNVNLDPDPLLRLERRALVEWLAAAYDQIDLSVGSGHIISAERTSDQSENPGS